MRLSVSCRVLGPKASVLKRNSSRRLALSESTDGTTIQHERAFPQGVSA
jgi:hypothetical protein